MKSLSSVRSWRNWQTHQLEGLAVAIPWWFESTRPHHLSFIRLPRPRHKPFLSAPNSTREYRENSSPTYTERTSAPHLLSLCAPLTGHRSGAEVILSRTP